MLPLEWVQQEISRINEQLIAAVSPEKIYVFGSSAQGRMTDHSDFDFLIIMPSNAAIIEGQKNLRTFYPLSQYPVDLVWATQARFETIKDIGGVCFVAVREGRCLYSKNSTHHKGNEL